MSWCLGSAVAINALCLFVASMAAQGENGAPSGATDAKAAPEMRERISTPTRAHRVLCTRKR
jgi:hypothetical protein